MAVPPLPCQFPSGHGEDSVSMLTLIGVCPAAPPWSMVINSGGHGIVEKRVRLANPAKLSWLQFYANLPNRMQMISQ